MIKKELKKTRLFSELRLDLVSGDWVIVASNRFQKPNDFKKPKSVSLKMSSKNCPFCNLETQKEPTLVMANGKIISNSKKLPVDWTTVIVPNIYPAVSFNFKPREKTEKTEGEIYKKMPAVGFHEVLITKEHRKQLADLSLGRIKEVISAWQIRYLSLKDKKFVNHISIFQNYGPESGASIAHPHSQIITTYLIDVDLKNALNNAKKYYNKKKKCLYCQMMNYDLKKKKRIVFENNNFVALCPFASKKSFQIIISPKKHLSYFENITEKEKEDLAESFKIILNKIKKGLNNPSYNFYLHTAPCDGKKHNYYHWHFTILPKSRSWAGFEMGTHLEIITVKPEEAAQRLRKIK